MNQELSRMHTADANNANHANSTEYMGSDQLLVSVKSNVNRDDYYNT